MYDRWFLEITNKKTLFERKLADIQAQFDSMTAKNLEKSIATYDDVKTNMRNVQTDLSEGTAHMSELVTALQYSD